MILPEAWQREVCKGLDAKAVAGLPKRCGHLVHDTDRFTRSHRSPGIGPVKLYHLKASVLTDEL